MRGKQEKLRRERALVSVEGGGHVGGRRLVGADEGGKGWRRIVSRI